MDLNATLFAQAIAFGVFVFGCRKFVWPPLIAILEERQRKIADGLAAAERGTLSLRLAQASAADQLKHARLESQRLVETAVQQTAEIVSAAELQAAQRREEILHEGRQQMAIEYDQQYKLFQTSAVQVVLAATEKIFHSTREPALDEAWVEQVLQTIEPSEQSAFSSKV